MSKTQVAIIGFLIGFLTLLPVVANAHWHHGGGGFWGFGAGFFTGYLFAPRPFYVAPPVYAAPPPVMEYPAPYYVPAPPAKPPVSGFSDSAHAGIANPPPNAQAQCREWRMISRQWQNRWDSYYGRWRKVLVEKWGWTKIPCNN